MKAEDQRIPNPDGVNHLRVCPPLRWSEQLIEILVFLFLIVPSMVVSLFFGIRGGTLTFELVAISTIVRDLSLVSLVLYFIWRNGESLHSLGWNFKNWQKEIFLGLILFWPIFFGVGLLDGFLKQLGVPSSTTPTPTFFEVSGAGEIALAFVLVVTVTLIEETIFRGYLLLRFQGVNFQPLTAAFLSAVIFSLGHGYEGTAGVISVGVLGLAFALVYLWRGSLVAPMVMHFLQDFIGLILVPLAGLK